MSFEQRRPDSEKILSGLKDFQRRTVDYVYRRLYEDEDSVRRFLIADEVGLGKTLVAKGVIARAVDRLWEKKDHRIDVVYICSNADIARQNINRLNLLAEDPPQVRRLTLLPKTIRSLKERRLNFVSFTPGTSFNVNSRSGVYEERALIYWILRKGGVFGGEAGPKNLLQCRVSRDYWRRLLDEFRTEDIDPDLADSFLEVFKANHTVARQFEELCSRFGYARKHVPDKDAQDQLAMVGTLRRLLAQSCAKSLEPVLVILDEFQRFKDLLDNEDDEGARLARALFNYPGARTLLLSATPYKMYTMYHETAEEDHYADFIRTVRFLFDSSEYAEDFERRLSDYRRGLLQLGSDGGARLEELKAGLENDLRKVMVRTERLPLTARRDGMVREITDLGCPTARDLESFAFLDRVVRELGLADSVEYWKSAPYLLSIMDVSGYRMKRQLVEILGGGDGGKAACHKDRADARSAREAIVRAMATRGGVGLLSYNTILDYREIEPSNARLRSLMSNVLDKGAWRLLWVPPSMPYYLVSGGPYADEATTDFTKALVFSSWQVVPKAVAMICSYEAERRMIAASGPVSMYSDEWRRRRPLLRFSLDRERRPTGMSAMTLLYPCLTLATVVDPLEISSLLAGETGQLPSQGAVVRAVCARVSNLLGPILERYAERTEQDDVRWYWAALALLDRRHFRAATLDWAQGTDQEESWASSVIRAGQSEKSSAVEDDEGDTGFAEHARLFCEYLAGDGVLGKPPGDLADVVARIALASPSVVAARSLLRVVGGTECIADSSLLRSVIQAAAVVAFGLRTMFNLPETIALLRGSHTGSSDDAYWQTVLDYSLQGNLQSVMDEYCHVLRESLGVVGWEPAKAIAEIAAEISEALSIRTVPLTFDEFETDPAGGPVRVVENRIRCRFAMRFSDGKDPELGKTRADQVRRAFNSPFRPFILASTSIGQEGLDFHQYCHDVYHWNLPSNPVDLEQREGRVHRYKGHVIRRNVARAFAGMVLCSGKLGHLADPWQRLFEVARDSRDPEASDLVPYWVFEVDGGYKVQRHVPAMPLSRELAQMDSLRKTLVAYRLVFGQPRQEDLVGYLSGRVGESIDFGVLAKAKMDLAPR